ncbi:MAG: bifunctional salicylyl-CoA 5-hydroxylase/oxidoreductase [Proteobacteria bacterium]|nr:bifunctional salicylyl-CoA 5-hydroxylase/oxidoreductase [Pseudomonadota bacterium]
MKIVCVGGGPAGLYFAISMKLRDSSHDITVYERNRPDDTFGWGVVFSDQTMTNLVKNDPISARQIGDNFIHWDDIDVHLRGERIRSTGHGFIGIGRRQLLLILQNRARELGVNIVFQTPVEDVEAMHPDADLIIAADGLNSLIRTHYAAEFGAEIKHAKNKFVWLGTHKVFEAFTFIFEETEHGWIWAHCYRFDKDTSTFIAECSKETWDKFGFEHMSKEETNTALERIFAKYLDGHKLMSNANHIRGSAWLTFPWINCKKWWHKNIILMGDAVHTAHFSIGSGTKLALEDAILLSEILHSNLSPQDGLKAYQDARSLEVVKLQNSARNSTEWFETVERYLGFEPIQFAYSLLTRSQRISHENLRLRDKNWLEGVETWFASRATGAEIETARPPMFTPFSLRGMRLKNRIVVSPMATYSAQDGVPSDFHLVHYGARAMGGAGLVYTEMTCVSPEGRITPGCPGMYTPEQHAAWRRIVQFVHANTDAKICMQLGHAGPKASTKVSWEGTDQPLEAGNWPILGPSPVAWSAQNQVPVAMTRALMDEVKAQFVRAAEMANDAGFDMIELHCAHGYLLSAFITPITNTRTDEYGGSLANRLRFPLEVFQAMRAAWPTDKPMSVRISATDWVDGEGITAEDSVQIAQAFESAGCDIIDVSTGQTSIKAKPVYGRMFQTPYSDKIRNELRISTMAVGNIFEIDHVNSILAAGRADLCCLARPHLADPQWTFRAAAEQGYSGPGFTPPRQYYPGFVQMERNFVRTKQMTAAQNLAPPPKEN